MEHYLNFDLTDEPYRFHVLLPLGNTQTLNFDTFDAHLQSIMSEPLYQRTRKLKPSKHNPEPGSVDFHSWLRQQNQCSKE